MRKSSAASPATTAAATSDGSITPWATTVCTEEWSMPPVSSDVLTPWGQRHDTVMPRSA